ncbi:protein translocase subunit SecF [Alphaproteobacteria bacterium]|nr:protein translocase subunit SecF [Alphaproteobacteria bacterium]
MKTIKLIPDNTSIRFMRIRVIAFTFSGLLILASIVSLFGQGLNFGIDFMGGTLIEAAQEDEIDISALRSRLNNLGVAQVQIQEFGTSNDVLIRISGQKNAVNAEENLSTVAAIREEIEGDFEIRRVEIVGPQVSGELIQAGLLAVSLAVISMLIYIWFRFEWQFSLGSVIALVHDVVLTLGIFSVLQIEFNISILAAILTIVGYSMNDTVVVYDRVREKLRKYKKMELTELLDLAINKTLSRTVMTSVTTLIALFSLYIFGGEVIRGFTFAMIFGIVVGTYSSIFVAAPILNIFGVKRDWSGLDKD